MAVQLLENWLLKGTRKNPNQVSSLKSGFCCRARHSFYWGFHCRVLSIQELFGTSKTIVNRGIRGYQTGLLLENLDAHLYGGAVDKIVLLIGTNDIGKDMPVNDALNNLEATIQSIVRDYPLTEIKLLSILPVNEGEEYKQTVYIRTNEKIQKWNQAYQELASAYMQVEFVPVFDSLTDQAGQLKKDYTTDGLHLSVAGYQVLTKALKDYLV